MTMVDAHSLIVLINGARRTVHTKAGSVFDYLSSAYINGLWASFGFVKAEGALVLGGLLSGGLLSEGSGPGGLCPGVLCPSPQ